MMDFQQLVSEDVLGALCGEDLGTGANRVVYAHRTDGTKVVKVAKHPLGIRSNIVEHSTWHAVQGTDIAQCFAPVSFLSEYGTLLIQERCGVLPWDKDLSFELPDVEDVDRHNLGMLEGRPVIIDYGFGIRDTNLLKYWLGSHGEELLVEPKQ